MDEFKTNCITFSTLGNDKYMKGSPDKDKFCDNQQKQNSYFEPFFFQPKQILPKPGDFDEEIDPIADATIIEIAKKVEEEGPQYEIMTPEKTEQDEEIECWD